MSVDYSELEDDFEFVASELVTMFKIKNREHGNSFFRGDFRDVYYSIRRKYHRIEVKMRDGTSRNLGDIHGTAEQLKEDLTDLACYSIMGLMMIGPKKLG